MLEGCADVIKLIQQKDFKELTEKSLELNQKVPNEDEHTTFLAIDFGICEEVSAYSSQRCQSVYRRCGDGT